MSGRTDIGDYFECSCCGKYEELNWMAYIKPEKDDVIFESIGSMCKTCVPEELEKATKPMLIENLYKKNPDWLRRNILQKCPNDTRVEKVLFLCGLMLDEGKEYVAEYKDYISELKESVLEYEASILQNKAVASEPKRCTKCNDLFPASLDYFYSTKNSKDGLKSECKICSKNYGNEHRSKDGYKKSRNATQYLYELNKKKNK